MYAGSSMLAEPPKNVIVISDDSFVSAVRGTPANGLQVVPPPESSAFAPAGVTETQRPSVLEG
jgi:hypothetical protein